MLADGMSSAAGLISTAMDGNSSVASSAVNSWGTTPDDVPCADGSIACSGASAGCHWLRGVG